MHPVRLQRRVPSSRFLEVARLTGHQLKFHKRHADGSGKCNIVFTGDDNDQVIGILYHILADEKYLLDKAEGVGKGYNITELELMGDRDSHIAFAYAADPLYIDDDLHPYPWYRALVVSGARMHGLPESYIRQLETHATVDDPDQERVELHMEIVHSHKA
jgi:hypothetical protein